MPSFRQLDDALITQTLEEVRGRIATRFPQANLLRLADELIAVGHEASATGQYLRQPNRPVRVMGAIAIVILVGLLAAAAGLSLHTSTDMSLADFVQAIEAGINDVVFFGVAVFFVVTIERRLKRRRALALLHQLRSLAHIVDMHQLTKDPERLMSKPQGPSDHPQPTTGVDLAKYLDLCSELLSMIAKIAALLVQHFDDDVVLAGVDEIEGLCTALSGKIWQKITILERATGDARGTNRP